MVRSRKRPGKCLTMFALAAILTTFSSTGTYAASVRETQQITETREAEDREQDLQETEDERTDPREEAEPLSDAEAEDTSSQPGTQDRSPVAIYVALVMLSLEMILFTLSQKRKHKHHTGGEND